MGVRQWDDVKGGNNSQYVLAGGARALLLTPGVARTCLPVPAVVPSRFAGQGRKQLSISPPGLCKHQNYRTTARTLQVLQVWLNA